MSIHSPSAFSAKVTPHAKRLRIVEVDHPATQAWKRELLAAAGIDVPRTPTYVPLNFERQTLAAELAVAGFAFDAHTFFSWLGVAPYLTEQAVFSTLAFIALQSSGAEVVFDYVNSFASIAPGARCTSCTSRPRGLSR